MKIRLSSIVALVFVAGLLFWALRSPAPAPVAPDDADVALDPDEAAGLRAARNPATATLDPAPHRIEISGIETLLWDGDPADPSLADRIGGRARVLGEALMGSPSGRRAGAELLAFSGRVGGAADVGYGPVDLGALRQDWLATRAAFAPASWMRGAEEPVREPATPALPTQMELTVLSGYADTLEALAGRAAKETAAFGDWHALGERSPELRALTSRYNAWVRSWDEALNRVDVPPQPPLSAATDYVMAWQDLSGAHTGLRTFTVGPGAWPMPDQQGFQRNLEQVEAQLVEARGRVQRLR